MQKVSIIGATGYTGIELLRLLKSHPHVEILHLISQSHAGEKMSDVYPHLEGICDKKLSNIDLAKAAEESDVIFMTLPNGKSQECLNKIIGKCKIIDLSGDFRIKNSDVYEKYYGVKHAYKEGINKFVYGLPEYNKNEIKTASNIANPGCFAITAQLALLPLKHEIHDVEIFAVTGSSGSGKEPSQVTHHPVRNHNMRSYKINSHQHMPEIMQTLGIEEFQMRFIPTSGPFTRGIHLTAVVETKKKLNLNKAQSLFKTFYKEKPFVRLKEEVQLADIIGSNSCDISTQVINKKIIIQAVIDNLVKGAAGNAIQNFNIMFDYDESEGLKTSLPLFP